MATDMQPEAGRELRAIDMRVKKGCAPLYIVHARNLSDATGLYLRGVDVVQWIRKVGAEMDDPADTATFDALADGLARIIDAEGRT